MKALREAGATVVDAFGELPLAVGGYPKADQRTKSHEVKPTKNWRGQRHYANPT